MRLLNSHSTTLEALHRLSQSAYVVTVQYPLSSQLDPSPQPLVDGEKPHVGCAGGFGELRDGELVVEGKAECMLLAYEVVVVVVVEMAVGVVVVVVVAGVVVGVVVCVVVGVCVTVCFGP
jgi:hypothetical protein